MEKYMKDALRRATETAAEIDRLQRAYEQALDNGDNRQAALIQKQIDAIYRSL